MRLGRSRAGAAEVAAHEDEQESTPYELAAIELLTVDGSMSGWIATDGARTSDWLNATDAAAIHGLRPHDAAQPVPPYPGAQPPTSVDRDRIVWVIPPPLPANRHLRLHRRRMRVRIELDAYDIVGQVHVRPGADAGDAIMRGTRTMVPLTDVEVRSRVDPSDCVMPPVLIVNATHVLRLISDGPRRSVPAADSAPVVATAPATTSDPASAASAATESAGHALVVLLEAGVIDVVEFQQMRARIGGTTP
ncbi:MAG: hypothetical protein ACXWWQ_06805 [Candidatus Limnocylindria bacterium]